MASARGWPVLYNAPFTRAGRRRYFLALYNSRRVGRRRSPLQLGPALAPALTRCLSLRASRQAPNLIAGIERAPELSHSVAGAPQQKPDVRSAPIPAGNINRIKTVAPCHVRTLCTAAKRHCSSGAGALLGCRRGPSGGGTDWPGAHDALAHGGGSETTRSPSTTSTFTGRSRMRGLP